jgi:hypothetical protein
MFSGCTSLQSVPLFNIATGSNLTNMFLNCTSLQSLPPFNMFSATASGATSNMVTGSYNLKMAAFSGSQCTIDYSGCSLARTELINIFNNLRTTGSIPCSITCSLNHGAADLTAADTASVINKGWTIKTS